ncbi:hypothetical protein EB001_03195 [bacterium]|nr:hypothetical protein [bacterium]
MQILDVIQKQCQLKEDLSDYNRLVFTHLRGAINDISLHHAATTYDLGMAQATREVILEEIRKYFEI